MKPLEKEAFRELGRQAASGPCPTEEMKRSCEEVGDREEACRDCHIFHAMRVAEEKIKCSRGE